MRGLARCGILRALLNLARAAEHGARCSILGALLIPARAAETCGRCRRMRSARRNRQRGLVGSPASRKRSDARRHSDAHALRHPAPGRNPRALLAARNPARAAETCTRCRRMRSARRNRQRGLVGGRTRDRRTDARTQRRPRGSEALSDGCRDRQPGIPALGREGVEVDRSAVDERGVEGGDIGGSGDEIGGPHGRLFARAGAGARDPGELAAVTLRNLTALSSTSLQYGLQRGGVVFRAPPLLRHPGLDPGSSRRASARREGSPPHIRRRCISRTADAALLDPGSSSG